MTGLSCLGERFGVVSGDVCITSLVFSFFFSSRRRHTRLQGDWSSDVCSSDLTSLVAMVGLRLLKFTVPLATRLVAAAREPAALKVARSLTVMLEPASAPVGRSTIVPADTVVEPVYVSVPRR